MSNIWTDQPREADGTVLLHIYVGNGYALQIQSQDIGGGIMNFSATVGNLFGSQTFIDNDLEQLLKTASAHVKVHVHP